MKLWLTWLFRLALGGIFLVSGISKGLDPHSFAHALLSLDLLSEKLIPIVGSVLPLIDFSLGLMLIVGFFIPQVSYAIVGLLTLFSVVILIQMFKGDTVECNCFGAIWQMKTD